MDVGRKVRKRVLMASDGGIGGIWAFSVLEIGCLLGVILKKIHFFSEKGLTRGVFQIKLRNFKSTRDGD